MIELVEKAEILRLRAARTLPDDDVERAFCVELRLHVVSLLTNSGPPLDPYSALRIARALDGACGRINGEEMDARGAAMCGRVILLSAANRTRSIEVEGWFERPELDGEVARREMGVGDYGEIVDAISRGLVRHRISETRSIGMRVWRRRVEWGE
jgi:hypothetical protein